MCHEIIFEKNSCFNVTLPGLAFIRLGLLTLCLSPSSFCKFYVNLLVSNFSFTGVVLTQYLNTKEL